MSRRRTGAEIAVRAGARLWASTRDGCPTTRAAFRVMAPTATHATASLTTFALTSASRYYTTRTKRRFYQAPMALHLIMANHSIDQRVAVAVSYTHLRAHETGRNLVCRLLLEKKK